LSRRLRFFLGPPPHRALQKLLSALQISFRAPRTELPFECRTLTLPPDLTPQPIFHLICFSSDSQIPFQQEVDIVPSGIVHTPAIQQYFYPSPLSNSQFYTKATKPFPRQIPKTAIMLEFTFPSHPELEAYPIIENEVRRGPIFFF